MSKSLGNSPDPLDDDGSLRRRRRALHHDLPDARPARICCSTRSGSRPASSSPTRSGTPRVWCACGSATRTSASVKESHARADARRPLDPVALRERREGRDAQPQDLPASTRPRTRSTTSPGTTTATGTSRWPSRAGRWPSARADTAGAGRPAHRALGGVEGARRHPAPAPSVHAVRDRGDLAGDAARRRSRWRSRRGRAPSAPGSTPRPSARSASCRRW